MFFTSRPIFPQSCRLGLALGFALLTTLPASAQLPLQKGDTVGIIGNALADRMQHDGWMETHLQGRLAGQSVSFRTLAVSGDTVTSHPRSKGVPSVDDCLAHCKADVVFAFFGYNESFGGEAKVASFKSDLGSMIDKYRAAKFNGESAPRIVLFLRSPMRTSAIHSCPTARQTTSISLSTPRP